MPIFFHAEAHLWILLTLFVNGFCIHLAVSSLSCHYRELTRAFESQVLISFAYSLAVNGLVLLALDLAGLPFAYAIYILLLISCMAIYVAWRNNFFGSWAVDLNPTAMVLYALMFVILFYNICMFG